MEDDFRYVINGDMFNNGDGKSSTTKVNIYGIPKQGRMEKVVRLIDIPGLGDTGGIKKDREHIDLIYQQIKNRLPFLNLIIYIFKAS
jgi:predicted GTPase